MSVFFRPTRARDGNWTHDPTLTKGVLYQLSYAGWRAGVFRLLVGGEGFEPPKAAAN